MLTRERIFPPINYIVDNEISVDELENLEAWILSEKVKWYYSKEIPIWKEKFDDEAVNQLIDEIAIVYDNNMSYSISFFIFPLIERMLREKLSKIEGNIKYIATKGSNKRKCF